MTVGATAVICSAIAAISLDRGPVPSPFIATQLSITCQINSLCQSFLPLLFDCSTFYLKAITQRILDKLIIEVILLSKYPLTRS